jgi:hypothetical protein
MTRRLVAALCTLAAAWLWFGVASPARRERDVARSEFARLRAERERVRSRVAEVERRAAVGRTPESGAAAARAMRRALLQATEGAAVGSVRIGAAPADRGRVVATGRLSIRGPLEAVLSVADRLADPRSGVLVQRAILVAAGPAAPEVRLDVDGVTVRSGP